MQLETKVISSLTKVFPDKVQGERIKCGSCFNNEPFSFQVAFKNPDDWIKSTPFYVRFESDLEDSLISNYKVGYVPVLSASYPNSDNNFDRKTPGLYPDILYKRTINAELHNRGFWEPQFFENDETVNLVSYNGVWQSLWFTINEDGVTAPFGVHKISIVFCAANDHSEIARETFELEILNKALRPQEVLYTSWFYLDCLADIYNVPIFSERHWEIIESFMRAAAKTGMNMVYLPAFTPALDTPVGLERDTVQLVQITKNGDEYSFDFSLMKRYVDLALKCGFTHFEHCHLFTQWGAQHAPKVMATVDGVYKRIFGWDTDSLAPEYAVFLKTYLKEFKNFAKENGIGNNILFHISDEPSSKHIEYYHNAYNVIKDEIEGCMCGDALSSYKFFEDGTVKLPIVDVMSSHMPSFVENCENFWVYYTGYAIRNGRPNRLIATTGARCRMMGTQMYYTGAKGFLHWGYNCYYGPQSSKLFNPVQNPAGTYPAAGTSFMVYPNPNGTADLSLRMKVLNEAFLDNRALRTLEDMIGKDKTRAFVKSYFGEVDFGVCPTNEELYNFRMELNKLVKMNLEK